MNEELPACCKEMLHWAALVGLRLNVEHGKWLKAACVTCRRECTTYYLRGVK